MVFVDGLFQSGPTKKWPYAYACHMFADCLGELDDHAVHIGLKLEWRQGQTGFVHYDLTMAKRALAIRCGAVELDRHATAAFINAARRKEQKQ